jgi:hypothetical protein
MLQVFQLFRTYVASVSFGCCKSRSGVTHVSMCVRYGGARAVSTCGRHPGGTGPARARKMRARAGGMLARARETSAARVSVQTFGR